jgi:ribosomal protein S18 acetylase RimI-like enzyme
MGISCEIRSAVASAADAAAILQVEHASLGDSSYNQARILQLLQIPAHFAYIAWVGDCAVGFCWCFETPHGSGKRLEIDLLGVLPSFRRQGIAAALINKARSDAIEQGITVFRAIVASDNLSSQHAFQRTGMRSAPQPAELLVYRLEKRTPEFVLPDTFRWKVVPKSGGSEESGCIQGAFSAELVASANLVAHADCLYVETLVYRGVWIERLSGVEENTLLLVRGLIAWCAQQRLDEVGILCSQKSLTQPGQYEALWRAGLESWGRFYVFS